MKSAPSGADLGPHFCGARAPSVWHKWGRGVACVLAVQGSDGWAGGWVGGCGWGQRSRRCVHSNVTQSQCKVKVTPNVVLQPFKSVYSVQGRPNAKSQKPNSFCSNDHSARMILSDVLNTIAQSLPCVCRVFLYIPLRKPNAPKTYGTQPTVKPYATANERTFPVKY